MTVSPPSPVPRARLHRHYIVLLGPVSTTGLLLGSVGAIVVNGPTAVHEPPGLIVILTLLVALLCRSLLYPLIRWWIFELVITSNELSLAQLSGLKIERIIFDRSGSTVRLSSGLLDAFLGTGTLTLATPREQFRFTFITPTDSLNQLLVNRHRHADHR